MVVEREAAGHCGYPLCDTDLGAANARRKKGIAFGGKYRIHQKKVFETDE